MRSQRELRQTVTGFRKGILQGRDSDWMCFAVCAPLQSFLALMGWETELVEVEVKGYLCDHWILRLPDGRVIDPTADQFSDPFGTKMPKVYIGELPNWYAESEEKK